MDRAGHRPDQEPDVARRTGAVSPAEMPAAGSALTA